MVNAAGWVVQTTDELGGIVTNHYYSDGGKAWSQVNNDARTKKSYLYDKAGRLKEYHDLSQAPNKIFYTYNAFGELITETNNAGEQTSYDVYDELGRLIKKTTPDGTVTYAYDAQKKGLPDYIQAGSSHKIEYTYDQYARPIKTTETIYGQTFETDQSYDAFGRASVLTYPSGYAVRHHYNSSGFPLKITEEGSNKQLWKAGGMNARNQYTALNYGSYISQTMTYYQQDGKLKQQSVANKQLNDYNWDKLGNLTYRKTRLGKAEGFSYDAMNRLKYVYHNGQQSLNYTYDGLGNLTYKSDVGNYTYSITDPYKLETIDNKPATIHNERQEIEYNWFNKVKTITERDPQSMAVVRQMDLWYGVGMQRVKQLMQNTGQPSETTWYVGGMYEKTDKNGQTTLTHYVSAPSGLVAVVKQTGSSRVINYVLSDHQGSVQLLLSEAGVILEEYSYDVWGLRRDPVTYNVYAVMPATQITHGYTGLEHLDLFMLVNMNGRVYDPVLGRFLSPDPVLQFPNYTQGHNPYAYVINNPLRYTDPSGYTLVGQLVATSLSMVAAAIPGVNLFVPVLIYSVAMTIDHAIELGRNAKGGELMGYFIQTFSLSMINMGATQMIGEYFKLAQIKNAKEFKRALAHGIFNGGMRMAQGGKFEHGFLSGFVSSLGGSYMQANAPHMSKGAQVALAAVIGGTAEALGGGKFSNGAVTGAYVMMLNHLQEVRTSEIANGKYDWNELSEDQRAQIIFDNIRQKNIEGVGTNEVRIGDFFYNLPDDFRIDIHEATVNIGGHEIKVWIDGNQFMKLGGPFDKTIHQKLYNTNIEYWYRIKYGVGIWISTPNSQINNELIWRYLDGHLLKSDILINP
jgi:RHS repeat-associated protein